MGPRYAASRPDVHSKIVAHIQQVVAPVNLIPLAADVGCGTGLSTRPLAAVARSVLGLDPAAAMLLEARKHGGVPYVRARAEALPLRGASVDLVTIGCTYHWCDPLQFLREAARVLCSRGWLVIYDNWILGQEPRSSAVLDWIKSEYWARLPRTPRNPLPDAGDFSHPSFDVVGNDFIDESVPMSRVALITYLTTQSSAVAAVESGHTTLRDLEAFLETGLSRFVPQAVAEFRFGGPIFYLRPNR